MLLIKDNKNSLLKFFTVFVIVVVVYTIYSLITGPETAQSGAQQTQQRGR